jgi:chloramphenicol-sensitive protein RarD
MTSSGRGVLAIVLAYAIWGLFPVYWKLLAGITAIELLNTRLMLTALACLLLLPLRGTWREFRAAWGRPRQLGRCMVAALFLSGNWFAFIWAVNSGKILESSLGYFLCPLVSVVLGRLIEREAFGLGRWLAVSLAATGVLVLILLAGRLPIAALVIAVTWSGYGLMKKRSRLGPVVGLGLETSLLSPAAALLLLLLSMERPLSLGAAGPATLGALVFAGFLTAAPLLLFAYAAQRIRLSTMGMGQYIVPSAHFALAAAYGEPVSLPVLAAFGLIWTGLGVYAFSAKKH